MLQSTEWCLWLSRFYMSNQMVYYRSDTFGYLPSVNNNEQELIRRWDSERELLCSAPRKLPEFAEITQNNGYYAVQGNWRSPILIPIDSSYTISY